MAFIQNSNGDNRPNFLESEKSLALDTFNIFSSMGKKDGGYMIVPAGTVYPTNDADAIGILFENVDVTGGDAPGAVLVKGRVIENNLTISAAAKNALINKGIVFVSAPGEETPWEYPETDGDYLVIKQVYSATENGDYLEVE